MFKPCLQEVHDACSCISNPDIERRLEGITQLMQYLHIYHAKLDKYGPDFIAETMQDLRHLLYD